MQMKHVIICKKHEIQNFDAVAFARWVWTIELLCNQPLNHALWSEWTNWTTFLKFESMHKSLKTKSTTPL
jgi:hypothetical protein